MRNKRGFTLAEVMIVLTVIGILAGILIPVANNSRPDENVMKFKKANATLANVIHELVTSDKYYCKGDLGLKTDCTTLIDGTHSGDYAYFCNTLADVLSVKENKCWSDTEMGPPNGCFTLGNELAKTRFKSSATPITYEVTDETIKQTKMQFDSSCMVSEAMRGYEFITADNIYYFQASHKTTFGDVNTKGLRYYSSPDTIPANVADINGFDIHYKIICVDVDGIPNGVTESNCVNECPFGYGIRVDGKIMPGAKADAWLEKGFQKGKKDN